MIKNVHTIDPVLCLLLQSKNQYLSGEKIAQYLSLSRSAIHKRVEKLRIEGYTIHAEPHKGFILKEPFPYKIIPEIISNHLSSSSVPEILFLKQTKSTNTIAKEMIAEKKDTFILLTREQTLGRGRMNRSWQMFPDQDIAMSFATPCNILQQFLFSIIRLTSVAVCQILNTYSNNQCLIKWPNDVITHDGKKICGILTESILEENEIRYLIIGIGININSTNHPNYAQSLRELIHQEIDINLFYSELITLLSALWKEFPHNEEYISNHWERLLAWKQEEVLLLYRDQEYQGILKSVLNDGSLILEIDHEEKTFFSGDLSEVKMRKHK